MTLIIFNHSDMAKKIKNLERIISREQLIDMTQAKNRRLRFEMTKRNLITKKHIQWAEK